MACPIQRGLARNHVLTEGDIHDSGITRNIGLKWKDLARALGFNEAKIEEIEKEKGSSCNECCIKLLVQWLQLKGEEATAGELEKALKRIGMKNLADNLIKGHKRCQCSCSLKGSLAESSSPDQDDCKKLLMSLEGEISKKDTRIKDLEDEVSSLTKENSSLRAKLKELEDQRQQDSDNTESPDIGEASGLSNDMDEAARETHINEKLKNLKEKLNEYVTKLLEMPLVNQDQLETPVKLNLLLRLTASLQRMYTRTLTMVTETCKCSEDLKSEFHDFAYHGLRAEHNELTHRVEDLESALPKMSEEEKRDFERLKTYQGNRQRQVERLDRLWKDLFSPPDRLAEASQSLPNGDHHNGDKSTNSIKVSRHTDPGAKPKQKKPCDQVSSSGMPSTNDDDKYEVQLNITTRKSVKGLFKRKEEEKPCVLLSCSSMRDS